MVEEWKDIKDFEGLYQVSNYGRVRSMPREGTKGGIIRQFKMAHNKYMKVHLYKNGVGKYFFVHRLVALAFIPNPENKPEVNHKSGNRYDNMAINLEWCSRSENMLHANRKGLIKRRMVAQIKNGEIVKVYPNAHVASKELGIDYTNIWYALHGIHNISHGYEWRYMHKTKKK